ncbi:hypothetical protein M3Y95_00766800 [Aphelenchoides besseyi]|nr:hypothetical protein M3Y95_00766800 [Aphelenchoides besseyi]
MSSTTSAVLLMLIGFSCVFAQFDRRKAVGPCVRGGKVCKKEVTMKVIVRFQCPPGHVCHQKECYPAPVAQMDDPMNDMFDDAKPQRAAIGPCINNLCPSGFTCNQADYKCY